MTVDPAWSIANGDVQTTTTKTKTITDKEKLIDSSLQL